MAVVLMCTGVVLSVGVGGLSYGGLGWSYLVVMDDSDCLSGVSSVWKAVLFA